MDTVKLSDTQINHLERHLDKYMVSECPSDAVIAGLTVSEVLESNCTARNTYRIHFSYEDKLNKLRQSVLYATFHLAGDKVEDFQVV